MNLEQWQARAAQIREGILRGAGLWPLPERCDLKPIILAKHLGLSLDKVSKPDGSIDESFVTLEKVGDLYVFNDAHPRPANAVKPGDATAIPPETVREWSAPYRGWHHQPNHVIPAKPGIKSFEDVKMTDVPTVFQVPGDKNWYMKEILCIRH